MVLKFVTGFGTRERSNDERATTTTTTASSSSSSSSGGGTKTETQLLHKEDRDRDRKGKWFVRRPKERYRNAPTEFHKPERKAYRQDDSIRGVHFVASDAELQQLIDESRSKGSKLFVEFGAAWCDHCKGMIPTMSDLAHKNKRHTFAVADVFHVPHISRHVVYTPTFWVYNKGSKVDQWIGSDKLSLQDRVWLHST